MIDNELEKHEGVPVSISNYQFDSPNTIKLKADEIAFITFIKINATANLRFSYSSATESRVIEKSITTPIIVESNIITKHLSSIKFSISNNDEYTVSVVIIKLIK